MDLPETIKRQLQMLPDKPGCYMMRDRRGRIIYVGKAASLRKRVQSYFRDATLRSATPKLRGLIRSAADLEWIVTRTEAEAILTEGKLIKDYRPRYNVSFRDDKRFLLLRINPEDPVPQFKPCRIRLNDGALYFGPYASSAAAWAALDFVGKRYGVRRCRPRIPGPADYRHCIDDIVRYCTAPCVGRISREGYLDRIRLACDFLAGRRPREIEELREAMVEAAKAQNFEKAAALRDTYILLRAAVRARSRIASPPEVRGEEARRGVAELQQALALPAAPRVIEALDISNISGTQAVASLVCAVDGVPQKNRYRRFRIRTVFRADDPAMMAEVVKRRLTRLQAEGGSFPDLILVDGGMAQVQSAVEQMRGLGIADISVAGLAKRFEEVYVPGRKTPLRLALDSPALKVLQRIRDEAHRFALTYHRKLRARRLRESVLDEIPGLGPRRKLALLQRFGSIRRMARASASEIGAVPGIGAALAHAILQSLGSLQTRK